MNGRLVSRVVSLVSLSALPLTAAAATFEQRVNLPHTVVSPTEKFGYAVSLSGDTAIVGVRDRGSAGAIEIFARSDGRWAREQVVLYPGNSPVAQFGASVAISGDTLAVGAPNDNLCGNGFHRGCVLVYVRNGSSWVPDPLTPRLDAGDTNAPDINYGTSVAIDGDVIAFGGPRGTGKIIIFERTSAGWMKAHGDGNGGSPSDPCCLGLGASVAVHGDLVIAGWPGDIGQKGSVRSYVRSGATWIPSTTLLYGDDSKAGDRFGTSVALSGGLVVVGGPGIDSDKLVEDDQGAAFIYRRKLTAGTDSETTIDTSVRAVLRSPSPATNNRFGIAVAASGDRVIVGEAHATVNAVPDVGVAHVFRPLDTASAIFSANWTVASTLTARGGSQGDVFGSSVSISGNSILVGAPLDDAGGAVPVLDVGSAYVFDDDVGGGGPAPDEVFINPQGNPGERAGASVAVTSDLIVVGAPDGVNSAGVAVGEVYLYARPGGVTAAAAAKIASSPSERKALMFLGTLSPRAGGSIGNKFGSSVDASPDGETIVVGAPLRGDGEVSVFRKPAGGWGQPDILPETIMAPADADSSPAEFGAAVAISESGAIAVGAPGVDAGAAEDAGAAYKFVPVANDFPDTPSEPPFVATVPTLSGRFGAALDMNDSYLAVGEPFDKEPPAHPGQLYLFASASGATTSKALGAAKRVGQIGDKFGSSVSIGGTMIGVGAPDFDMGGTDTGAGFLFRISGNVPVEVTQLATNGKPGERAGRSISVAVDSELATTYVVLGASGAERDFRKGNGTVYFFGKPTSSFDDAVMTAPDGELAATQARKDQGHGSAVAIDAMGAVVGAPDRVYFPPAADPDATTGNASQGEVEAYIFDDAVFRSGFE